MQASIGACHITYDGALLAKCLSDLSSGTCPANPTCKGFLTGLVPLAGACTNSYECVAGTYCNTATSKCTAQKDYNNGCASDVECLNGYYCRYDVGVGTCKTVDDSCYPSVFR